MTTHIRWIAGAALLVLVVAGCGERSLVQPEGPSFGRTPSTDTGTTLPDSNGMHTGYFGSGHNQQDTMNTTPPG